MNAKKVQDLYARFSQAIKGKDALEKAVEWVKENLYPDEVFSEEELTEWATDNGFCKVPKRKKP